MNKKEIRKQMLSILESIPENERKNQDESIALKIGELPELCDAECFFAYIGIGYEIKTTKIIEKLLREGKCVCVPLCYGSGKMDAIKITSLDDLHPGRYGIPEPPANGEKASPSNIDAIIVPGVAFDKEGRRLGRGGGYYDRFMESAINAKKIALCREINLIDEVPCEEHDESVDIIVTEKKVIRK